MPSIKLIQTRGEYSWNNQIFNAGIIYSVSTQTANYLIVDQKVAVEINADNTPAASILTKPELQKPKKLRIALIRIGGIGDTIILAGLATAVKRRYDNSETTLFIRDKGGYNIIDNHPDVDHVVLCNNMRWETLLEKVKGQGFDIIYDNRYVTKVIYRNPGQFKADKIETDLEFKQYTEFYKEFPLSNNRLSTKVGVSERKLGLKTAGLDGSDDDLFISILPDDQTMTILLKGSPYITVHNGSDIARQTKCWSTKNWETVVEELERDYKIIQLGSKYEEHIKGTINLTGKTSIKQTADILEKARFHIDTESGLVHLARAVRTRSIVLFGPTPVHFFGYKENINITSDFKCKECWWKSDMWWRECPEKYLEIKCMSSIKPMQVIDAAVEIEKLEPLKPHVVVKKDYDENDINEQFAIELPLGEAHYKSEPWQFDRVHTMMGLCKGKTVLEVGAGDGYCVEELTKQGYDVTAIEISKIRLQRMLDKGLKAQYADINNLPFPDNSFDSVICGEVLEHIPSMAKGWAELERVCKSSGKIIISLPVGDIHRQTAMHLWGISHHAVLREDKVDMIVLAFDQLHRK